MVGLAAAVDAAVGSGGVRLAAVAEDDEVEAGAGAGRDSQSASSTV